MDTQEDDPVMFLQALHQAQQSSTIFLLTLHYNVSVHHCTLLLLAPPVDLLYRAIKIARLDVPWNIWPPKMNSLVPFSSSAEIVWKKAAADVSVVWGPGPSRCARGDIRKPSVVPVDCTLLCAWRFFLCCHPRVCCSPGSSCSQRLGGGWFHAPVSAGADVMRSFGTRGKDFEVTCKNTLLDYSKSVFAGDFFNSEINTWSLRIYCRDRAP